MPSDNVPAEIIEYLRRPEVLSDRPTAVTVIETHFAWVFLARTHAYKLKKPIRFLDIDFSSLEARRDICEREVELNRRLAASVYIGVVALTREDGGLRLEGDGPVVEWLVKMHRLPQDRSLERAATEQRIEPGELERVVQKLATFYGRTAVAPWTSDDYRRSLVAQTQTYCAQIEAYGERDASAMVSRLRSAYLEFVDGWSAALGARIERGRIVDAHGDLRPEHIFLGDDPQIIDCLEFSAELRLLDTVEEIAFLDLECGRLGQPELGRRILRLYKDACNDRIDERLYQYYRSRRCLVRALVSLWHIEDFPSGKARSHWIDQCLEYLHSAEESITAALAG